MEQLKLLGDDVGSSSDDDNEMDMSSLLRKGKHNYAASRIMLDPETLKNIADEVAEEEEKLFTELNEYTSFIDTLGYFIPFLYGAFFTIILGCYITGFIEKELQEYLIWSMIVVLFFGSILGIYSIYKYGVIDDHIDDMKIQNDDYQNELNKLGRTNKRLSAQVRGLKTTVSELNHDADKLEAQTDEFEHLVRDLNTISIDNADVGNILDDTNQIFDDMRKVVLENERAYLLTAYYECAFRDDDNAMDEAEYKRFKARLSKKQRKKFDDLGSFKQLAGPDGQMDLERFQQHLQQILENVDELLKEEFSKINSNKKQHKYNKKGKGKRYG